MISPYFIIQRAYAELLDGEYFSALSDMQYSLVRRLLSYNDETKELRRKILNNLYKLIRHYDIDTYDETVELFKELFDVLKVYDLDRWDE